MNQTHEFERTSDGQLIAWCFVYGRVCVYALMLSKERGLNKVYQPKLASITLTPPSFGRTPRLCLVGCVLSILRLSPKNGWGGSLHQVIGLLPRLWCVIVRSGDPRWQILCGFNDYTTQLRVWAPLCMRQCVCVYVRGVCLCEADCMTV